MKLKWNFQRGVCVCGGGGAQSIKPSMGGGEVWILSGTIQYDYKMSVKFYGS